jgi:nanoRNase/pAp phosphatase (c-di-AMP/oligoRNAs hydrolase)|tara:strand:+ start:586 stop:816 length:231 start_codon:yes stop_codon:yes gene_type:complete
MTVTIDGKNYDETKLDDKAKNAVVQVQQGQVRLKQLQNEFDNVKIIIDHHSKYLKDNLPASAVIETAGEPVETPKV